ncbi:hypothetical protein Bra3105_18255 [Brachybacterium halotolerans subsp. kimchii]|uniref:hypothetical protein n=1 Tax=Brachybacterium halotolerans TaxID=2795215 RepID=UPI001E54C62D|nr:hypothetical protein [Brachybacterium halotolerans]UEJ82741.1 hypothetical protein Bra3105_18255 [Brachybacterium halotolerans subsp. kimchii]
MTKTDAVQEDAVSTVVMAVLLFILGALLVPVGVVVLNGAAYVPQVGPALVLVGLGVVIGLIGLVVLGLALRLVLVWHSSSVWEKE